MSSGRRHGIWGLSSAGTLPMPVLLLGHRRLAVQTRAGRFSPRSTSICNPLQCRPALRLSRPPIESLKLGRRPFEAQGRSFGSAADFSVPSFSPASSASSGAWIWFRQGTGRPEITGRSRSSTRSATGLVNTASGTHCRPHHTPARSRPTTKSAVPSPHRPKPSKHPSHARTV